MHLDKLKPRYTVLRELGSGGMGCVYLAQDHHLRKELALKILHESPGQRGDLDHLAREYALLAKLEHAGVARAYDFGFVDGVPYFTSEFISGETLAAALADGPCRDPADLLDWTLLLTAAVAFLHRGDILHLDVKPSNIIVSELGRPVLIDFGLFRHAFPTLPNSAGPPPGERSSGQTPLHGSLPYMAPEYFHGGRIDTWTDVYALGVTMYQMATGRLPRPGATVFVDGSRGNGPDGWRPAPTPPSHLHPSLPRELDAVILKALTLEPENRFRSAVELLELLSMIGDQCATSASPHDTYLIARDDTAHAATRAPAGTAAQSVVIGRDVEVTGFDRFLDSFVAGSPDENRNARVEEDSSPPLLLLTGASGMGLTHLLTEMKIKAQTRGVPFYLQQACPSRRPSAGALLRPLGMHLEEEARARWDRFLERLGKPRTFVFGQTTQEDRRLRWRGEIALARAALRQPMILAADDLHNFDEVSALLFLDLARVVVERAARPGQGLGLVVSCREEGPLAHIVRELGELMLASAPANVMTLNPLGPVACRELYRVAVPRGHEPPPGLSLFQKTGGSPSEVMAYAMSNPGQVRGASPSEVDQRTAELPRPGTPERDLFVALAILERPAAADELARLSGLSARVVDDALDRLHEIELTEEERPGSALSGWMLTSCGRQCARGLSKREQRQAHRLLADGLRREGDMRALIESVGHDDAAGRRAAFVEYGLKAARYLQDTFQNRTAIDLLERILTALPPARKTVRLQVVLSLAELLARIGELDRGIALVRGVLREPKVSAENTIHEILLRLRLATLHSRNGDFQLAESLFREAFETVNAGKVRLKREDRLIFVSEHAALKVFLGDHEGALALCAEGLTWAARGRRSRTVEEIALNLHATRANVALRGFHFDAAVRDFQVALKKAEAIGSAVNQAVILNNLGIAFTSCDRYADAKRAFRDAEKTCLDLDEGPSLSFILGNLAVLHARSADYATMEELIEKAAAITVGDLAESPHSLRQSSGAGRRQRLFLEHHRGLSLVCRGRYREARPHLEIAVRLGQEVGDRLLASFDEVFLAECLLFEAEYEQARAVLLRLCEESIPEMPRGLARARLALLEAFLGNNNEIVHLIDNECAPGTANDESPPEGEKRSGRRVPFLEAGNNLFVAWALAIAGEHERARDLVTAAEGFFRRHGLLAGASLGLWIRAEILHLEGHPGAALELIDERPERESDLVAVLWPLLEARCLLDTGAGDGSRCADQLAEAGTALLRCPLPEWSARFEVIRAALTGGSLTRGSKEHEEIACRLSGPGQATYLKSEYWQVWSTIDRDLAPRPFGSDGSRGATDLDGRNTGESKRDAPPATRTVILEAGRQRSIRRGLVAHSKVMRALVRVLDRLRASELPVLITGETGTGKELVAKIIHIESSRAGAPFSVVDCAAVPEQLLDLELFGGRRGAFTGLDEDRPGLLERACGGTVLFDEIGAMSLSTQVKLLRLLAGGQFRPVGGERPISVDTRFLFTTSNDLDVAVRESRFRADLLYRIHVLVLEVPPLRERREDIPYLARLFFDECAGEPPEVEPAFFELLAARPWPGNVRELRNFIKRVYVERTRKIPATAAELPPRGQDPESAAAFPHVLLETDTLEGLRKRLEHDYILYHFKRLGGDTRALSELLGVRREQLYRRCAALGIRLRDLRG